MSMMVSFCAVFFPRGVLDEILNLIESVSEGFPSYSFIPDFPCCYSVIPHVCFVLVFILISMFPR